MIVAEGRFPFRVLRRSGAPALRTVGSVSRGVLHLATGPVAVVQTTAEQRSAQVTPAQPQNADGDRRGTRTTATATAGPRR